MKVLIETITSRRGYKNFADKVEFDDFLAQNHNKITGYQILQEDDAAVIRQITHLLFAIKIPCHQSATGYFALRIKY